MRQVAMAILTLSEGIAQDRLLVGAACCSVVVVALGVISEFAAMMVAGVAVGIVGWCLIMVALDRNGPPGASGCSSRRCSR
ncbi:hypothetical protein [Nocardia australiensis]|uniref:hypothetical protein n=1 Tax=Nocardia australiensis TaxID=2887191 RepID=UPI001D14CA44|nr:hypothetical protein [Nocardia australiensis]